MEVPPVCHFFPCKSYCSPSLLTALLAFRPTPLSPTTKSHRLSVPQSTHFRHVYPLRSIPPFSVTFPGLTHLGPHYISVRPTVEPSLPPPSVPTSPSLSRPYRSLRTGATGKSSVNLILPGFKNPYFVKRPLLHTREKKKKGLRRKELRDTYHRGSRRVGRDGIEGV